MSKYLFFLIFIVLLSCGEDKKEGFSILTKNQTNLDFRNLLKENEEFNIFKYQYFYNGGGVALADFNNDGLEDIFFTGNMVKNRLYLNEGNLKFKNITQTSGVAKEEGWCTGANAVDINQDGWMDIYVCRAGFPFPDLRKNLLYINNKDNTFTESATSYGLDDAAYSTQATFFDYDRDGDLDMLLVNHSTPEYSKGNLEVVKMKSKQNPAFINKLYRNDDGHYSDVTMEAGITGNVLSFSLGAVTFDINNDDFPDIYITNDFNEYDYIFINQKDGTFKELSAAYLMNQSKFSMGVDFGDIDQNGYSDLIVLDMLPESNYAQKMHMGADNYDKVNYFVSKGFQQQFSRNTMLLNYANSKLNEVGQAVGISNTDWSWSPLLFDFDNDMELDLFISNGYPKDHTDLDFLQYTADLVLKLEIEDKNEYEFEEYVAAMPPIAESNYFFSRDSNHFVNKAKDWGLTKASVSQGAAYADLDNDGDLDLVINNTNEYAFICENKFQNNNWISFSLEGGNKNINGIGSKLALFVNGKQYLKELQPARGFQSTGSYTIYYGLDNKNHFDSLQITWPDGSRQFVAGAISNKNYRIKKNTLKDIVPSKDKKTVQTKELLTLEYLHNPDHSRDFNVQRLMPFFITDNSPNIYVFDIDNNGYEDIIISGSNKNSTEIFYQFPQAKFTKKTLLSEGHYVSDIACDDITGNGYLDIVLTIGSYTFGPNENKNSLLLLKQTSKGVFEKTEISLKQCNPSCLSISDLNGDGHKDIFCGGDYWKGMYPISSASCLLLGKPDNTFATPTFLDIGNIKDCENININNNSNLVTTGHWNHIKFFTFTNKLEENTINFITDTKTGFWNTIKVLDIDKDGDQDILMGNMGINSQLKASEDHPMEIIVSDIDKNGSIDPIMGVPIGGIRYPFPSREDLISQVPSLKKQYVSFDDYARVDFHQFLSMKEVANPEVLSINELSHILLRNDNGQFTSESLPWMTQMSPIYTFESQDLNKDGNTDIFIGGNKSKNLVKIGNLSSSQGKILFAEKDGNYKSITNSSPVFGEEYRSSAKIRIDGEEAIVLCPLGGQLSLQKLVYQ